MNNFSKSNDNKPILWLFTKTWSRDSHGLFDYECLQTKNRNIYIYGNGKVIRKNHDVAQISDTTAVGLNDQYLLSHNLFNDKYSLSNQIDFDQKSTTEAINNLQEKIWLIIKADLQESQATQNLYEEMNDFITLCKNDIIKLGRVKYAISELTCSKQDKKRVFDLVEKTKFNLKAELLK